MSEPDGPDTGISKQRGGSLSVEERSMWKVSVIHLYDREME